MGKQFTRLPERGPEPALKPAKLIRYRQSRALKQSSTVRSTVGLAGHNPATLAPGKPSDGVTTSRQRRGAPTKTRNKDHADRVLKREVRGAIQPDRSAAFRTHDCKRGRGRALRRKVSFGSDSDLTAPESHFRSTPRPDIADRAGHVGFVPKTIVSRCNNSTKPIAGI
jgi:hypothetical protein